MKIAAPKVESVRVSKLKPWGKNPRKNHAVDAIARSIETFGYLSPIVAQKGTYRILAGHGRLEALKKRGVTEVPVVVADIDDDQASLYTIADNKLTELAGWDFAGLAELLKEFDAKSLDVSLTGFNEDELARIARWMPAVDREETEPVPAPPAKPVSRPGDLWKLGAHRLLCGDSTKPEDLQTLMSDAKASLMNTDPPYGVDYGDVANSRDCAANKRKGGSGKVARDKRIENDDLTGPALQSFLEKCLFAARPHLIENPAFYLWHPMLTQGTFFAAAAAAAILIHRQIIWIKPSLIMGRGDYHWRHELCFYGWFEGKRCAWLRGRDQDTVWAVGRENDHIHPTQKPVELFVRPIENHTHPGDVIYEPFSGSGSQIIAAEMKGRRCYAMELEPKYVDVAVMRWQNYTGKRARNLKRSGVEVA